MGTQRALPRCCAGPVGEGADSGRGATTGAAGAGAGTAGGALGVLQAAKASSTATTPNPRRPWGACCNRAMALLILEALGALLIFVFIIWWTMFSGRKGGERMDRDDEDEGGRPGQ